jgi:phage-related protein
MLSIIYNNKDSYDDFALIMERLPSLPCSKAEYETIDIEGRDGTLNIFKNYSEEK